MRRLLIFIKDPRPGRVKTRLAATLGDQAACEVYRACAELTLSRLQTFRDEAALCVDPPEALARMRRWVGPRWSLQPQCGMTLGDRLRHAADEAFAQGATRVVIIGTDSPWLAPADIREAFAALAHAELVVGPTEDGGYYLIGLSCSASALFKGVAWSSSRVYAQTRRNARALGLRTRRLRMGYDVDRVDDLPRMLAEAAAQRDASALAQTIERVCARWMMRRRREPCLS
ncbi:MAG: TIGR04282 family arsenosugar biosynthesis glycosyltransferase [Candidatus Omnitrophica bacterium]|nr:TIGR04282 family arsenosugar biosynthesis glycosyltransferase [Candidatus Omnitrophota bacterium]